MKKWIIPLIVVVIGVMLLVSCPNATDHKDSVTVAARECLSANLDSSGVTSLPIVGDLLAEGGKMLGDGVLEEYFDKSLTTHNYMVFSNSTIEVDDKPTRVAFGILGHVFITDKEAIDEALGTAIKSKIIDTATDAAKTVISTLL